MAQLAFLSRLPVKFCTAFCIRNSRWTLLPSESYHRKKRALVLTAGGGVGNSHLFSKRGTALRHFFPWAPAFPLDHSHIYKHLSLSFHDQLTSMVGIRQLLHLPVWSLPLRPFQRLNSGTVAKQQHIIAAGHQFLIVLSTSALQIWIACDNGK